MLSLKSAGLSRDISVSAKSSTVFSEKPRKFNHLLFSWHSVASIARESEEHSSRAVTQCGLILLVTQSLTFLKAKWVLLFALFFFELGSLICAVAKVMTVMIVGRAIQGVGEYILHTSSHPVHNL